jgi:ribosomal-protein-alanine N-acetyltransferase
MLEHNDAEPWFAVIQDLKVRSQTSWAIDTVEQMRALVADYIDGPRTKTTRRWAIIDEQNNFRGTCGFKDWDRSNKTAELSYELAAKHRGQGAMTTIATAVIAHGRTEMQLRAIRALVMVENTPSIRLLEKLGFKQTAIHPAFRTCGGVLRDFYSYELS